MQPLRAIITSSTNRQRQQQYVQPMRAIKDYSPFSAVTTSSGSGSQYEKEKARLLEIVSSTNMGKSESQAGAQEVDSLISKLENAGKGFNEATVSV